MLEIIAIVILISSIFGIGVIMYRKMPEIKKLPEVNEAVAKNDFLLKAKENIKNIPILKIFSFEIYLQKILSKIRILTLKIDSKTFNWLQRLRKKSQKKKFKEDDNYWEEIKESTKK